jgi:hypothetical protein
LRKKRAVAAFLVLVLIWLGSVIFSYAQKVPKTLTLLYSNNVNGEIDLCPT